MNDNCPVQEPEVLEFRRCYCRECGKKCEYPSFKMFACLLARIADKAQTEQKNIEEDAEKENENRGKTVNETSATRKDC